MKKLFCIMLSLTLLLTACRGAEPKTGAEEPSKKSDTGYALKTVSIADYPVNPNLFGDLGDSFIEQSDNWYAALNARRDEAKKVPGMEEFTKALFEAMYEDGKNLVYSPMNIYMALSMLAEITDGETRNEILRAIGADSIETVRTRAKAIAASEIFDDGAAACLIADSFWLNDSLEYKEAVLETLRSVYFADSFSGDPKDEGYNEAFRAWINEKTKDLLKDSVSKEKLDRDLVMALVSTIWFKAAWTNDFNKNLNTNDVFHAPEGDETAVFMHIEEHMNYIDGEGYTAVCKSLKEGAGGMWFILPDEGVPMSEALAAWTARTENELEWRRIEFSMPKLDVSGRADLLPVFEKLGVTSCLVPGTGDFTPLADLPELYVSQASHAARLTADEEGVEAAAYTIIQVANGAFIDPDEPIVFTLDRPFLFVLTGTSAAPMFVGAVNTLSK